MNDMKRHSKKVLVAIVGGIVVVVGLVLVPYPGPGWLIVFAGLAILATEFKFASRVLDYARGKYHGWVAWLKRQNIFVQSLMLLFTGVVVVLTIWLMNGYGLIDNWFNLNQAWLHSPLLRK